MHIKVIWLPCQITWRCSRKLMPSLFPFLQIWFQFLCMSWLKEGEHLKVRCECWTLAGEGAACDSSDSGDTWSTHTDPPLAEEWPCYFSSVSCHCFSKDAADAEVVSRTEGTLLQGPSTVSSAVFFWSLQASVPLSLVAVQQIVLSKHLYCTFFN